MQVGEIVSTNYHTPNTAQSFSNMFWFKLLNLQLSRHDTRMDQMKTFQVTLQAIWSD